MKNSLGRSLHWDFIEISTEFKTETAIIVLQWLAEM